MIATISAINLIRGARLITERPTTPGCPAAFLWIAIVERQVDTPCYGKHALRQFFAALNAVENEALGSLDESGRAVEGERLGLQGVDQSHADADRLLIARLRDEETKHLITEALECIDDCRRDVNKETRLHGDKHLIKSLLNARLASEDPEKLARIYERDAARHQELKDCADRLEKYFSDEIFRDPESLIVLGTKNSGLVEMPDDQWPVDFESLNAYRQARVSLQRMQHILARRIDKLSGVEFRFTRKMVLAQKTIFMATVCEAMKDIFGQPLYKAVAKLTDVALAAEEQTDDHQARAAYRGTRERQAALDHSGRFVD